MNMASNEESSEHDSHLVKLSTAEEHRSTVVKTSGDSKLSRMPEGRGEDASADANPSSESCSKVATSDGRHSPMEHRSHGPTSNPRKRQYHHDAPRQRAPREQKTRYKPGRQYDRSNRGYNEGGSHRGASSKKEGRFEATPGDQKVTSRAGRDFEHLRNASKHAESRGDLPVEATSKVSDKKNNFDATPRADDKAESGKADDSRENKGKGEQVKDLQDVEYSDSGRGRRGRGRNRRHQRNRGGSGGDVGGQKGGDDASKDESRKKDQFYNVEPDDARFQIHDLPMNQGSGGSRNDDRHTGEFRTDIGRKDYYGRKEPRHLRPQSYDRPRYGRGSRGPPFSGRRPQRSDRESWRKEDRQRSMQEGDRRQHLGDPSKGDIEKQQVTSVQTSSEIPHDGDVVIEQPEKHVSQTVSGDVADGESLQLGTDSGAQPTSKSSSVDTLTKPETEKTVERSKKSSHSKKPKSYDYTKARSDDKDFASSSKFKGRSHDHAKVGRKEFTPTIQSDELAQQLTAETYECMVCCESVRERDQIWSCQNCYHIFHLKCIKKWASAPTFASTEEGEQWILI